MKQLNVKKLVLLNLPYILLGLFATNLGEAWRLATGADASAKMLSFFSTLPVALGSWWPSLHPLDLAVGLCCGAALRLAVYLKGKNAKKYRHNVEYGSARWGTHEDIAPYIDPVFQNNVILTQTERLTMSSRPKNPKYARNKNVLVIGGSGSGKTRFWLKPNLMQMHSSYVVTDPKGTILVECGKMLQRGAPKLGKDGKPVKDKHGKIVYEPYQIKVLNTINFKKSIVMTQFREVSRRQRQGHGFKLSAGEPLLGLGFEVCRDGHIVPGVGGPDPAELIHCVLRKHIVLPIIDGGNVHPLFQGFNLGFALQGRTQRDQRRHHILCRGSFGVVQ